MKQTKVPNNRNYNMLTQSTKAVLEEFRDEVYETHGMVNPQLDILVNLFYHLMWEITLATDPTSEDWEESEEFKQKHEELAKLLDYRRIELSEDYQ